jgi:hypothetical protein
MRIKKENFPMLKWLEIDGDNDDKILSILREIRTSIDFEDSFEFKKQWTLLADLFEKWNDVRSNIKDKIYYVSDTFHRNALKSIIMFSKIDFEDFISDNKDNVGLIIHGSGTQLYYDFSDYKNRCIYSFAGRDVNFIYKVFDNESYIVSMDLEAEDFINIAMNAVRLNDIFGEKKSKEILSRWEQGKTSLLEDLKDPQEMERSKLYMAKSVEQNLKSILLLKHYAKVETLYLNGGEKKKDTVTKEKHLNESNLPITILDSTWFNNIIRTSPFGVSGHFRLQPKKDPSGKWIKELIYIKPFIKNGYNLKAKKSN